MISFFTSAYSLLRLAALRLAVSCGLISAANAVVVGPLLASQRTRGESVSREEKVAVVEAYLRGLAGKDISKIPFAANITFEGPRVGKLIGRNAVVGFLTSILSREILSQQSLKWRQSLAWIRSSTACMSATVN